MPRIASILAGLALIASAAALADGAEVYTLLAHTQKIQGLVPPGDPIRLEFPMPAGAEPRLTFTLVGSKPLQPISFVSTRIIGPDGQDVVLPSGQFFFITHTNGRDSLTFRGWTSTQSGNHQLVIETNARIPTQAKGKLTIVRPTKVGFKGDETSAPIQAPLMRGDVSSVVVTKVSGTAPKVASYQLPSGPVFTPGQKMTKRGSTSNGLFAAEFGPYSYTIGYQTTATAPAAGKWKATVRIIPFKGGAPATLQLRNTPGVPLSVLTADRFIFPTFGTTGIGVATDGVFVVVSSEQGGVLNAQPLDLDLQVHQNFPNPVALTNSVSDFTPGETLAGHRLMFMAGHYYAAFSTASGQELSLLRLRTDLVREGFSQLVTSSVDPTTDFFLTGNGPKVSVGIFHAPDTHDVTLLDAADFGLRSSASIGGPLRPQRNGAGAAWRANDSVFELWTPDTLDFHGPSDLHRVLFDAAWAPTTPDAKLVNDIGVVETMPTAVTVDAGLGKTNATIIHYVVADNPPLTSSQGAGRIHRRIFDATGVEVPGSHVILPRDSCNRPVSAIFNNFLYVGYETPAGPIVERYQLLR